jgi:hypothetical protein
MESQLFIYSLTLAAAGVAQAGFTPVANWGTETNGTFDASGNFSISLPVNPASRQLFCLLQTP